MMEITSYFTDSSTRIPACIATLVVTLVSVKIILSFFRKDNGPPGPRGLPLFGYLPFFGDNPHLTFMRLREKYGNIFSIQMGSHPAVVLHGKDLIKEALVNRGDDFSGRPKFCSRIILGDTLSFGEFNDITILHKRLATSVLFKFVNSRKNPIEEIINYEVKMAVSELAAMNGKPLNPRAAIFTSIGSIIYKICFGQDQNIREEDHTFFKLLLINLGEFGKFVSASNLVNAMPYLRFLMPLKMTSLRYRIDRFRKMVLDKIEEKKKTYTLGDSRHLTDGLIAAVKDQRDNPNSLLTEKKIFSTLFDIVSAGCGSVSIAFMWVILCLTKYPHIQEKVHKEIDDILGKRQPKLQDKQNMDYCMATINEVMRFICLFPLSNLHSATKDTELCGFSIKKDTVVILNSYSISHDKETWGDPNTFRPERYLDSGGKLDKTIMDRFNVFSMGRRKCPGEFLARMEMFLLFTGIFQLCKFSKAPNVDDFKMEYVYTLFKSPKPFKVCVTLRD